MKLTVAKVKSFIGNEGYGFNADLLADGKKVAFVMDAAWGGEYEFDWVNPEAQAQVEAYVKSLPITPVKPDAPQWERDLYPNGHEPHLDSIVGTLVDEYDNNKQYVRLSKTRVVHRDVDGPKYFTSTGVLTKALHARIVAGSPTAEIFDAEKVAWVPARDVEPVSDDVANAAKANRLLANYRKTAKTAILFRRPEDPSNVRILKTLDMERAIKYLSVDGKLTAEIFDAASGKFISIDKIKTQPKQELVANAH